MNITIPIECQDGHQFLLRLTDCSNLPIELKIEIVDNVYGDHYIHLMSKSKYSGMLDNLETKLNDFNK